MSDKIELTSTIFWEVSFMSNQDDFNKPLTKEEIDCFMANFAKYQTKENIGRDLKPIDLERIRYFAEHDDGKPFYMINLIKENKEVVYPDDWTGQRATSMLEAKKLYGMACLPFLQEKGSDSIFGVTFTSPAALNETNSDNDWDQFYLVRYKSRRVFLELVSSEFYSKAIVHKYACDKNTVLIPVTESEVLDYKNDELFKSQLKPISKEEADTYIKNIKKNLDSNQDALDRFRYFAEHDDGKPFFMVNLVKARKQVKYPDNWSGERAKNILESKKFYALGCQPIKHLAGTTFVVNVSFTSPEVFNDSNYSYDFDQFYIVGYKSRRAFFDLLSHEVYANAYIHKNAGDEYTVLIPVNFPA